MKISKYLFYLLGLMIVISSVACSGDDDDDNDRCGDNWDPGMELEDEINALNEAAQIYSMDPTPENCEAWKDAYLDYLDELREWEDCYILIDQQQAFINAVEQAEQAVMDIEC